MIRGWARGASTSACIERYRHVVANAVDNDAQKQIPCAMRRMLAISKAFSLIGAKVAGAPPIRQLRLR